MPSQNTLELAKQGDPAAIATILTYYLSQRFNTVVSVIRLGNYLSVLIETTFAAYQERMVEMVLTLIQELNIDQITTIEITGRRTGDGALLWNQTVEIPPEPHTLPTPMNSEILPSSSASAPVAAVPAIDLSTINTATNTATSDSPAGSSASAIAEQAARQVAATTPAAPPQDEWDVTVQNLLRRPEMVALLAFALALAFWETYMEWMAEVDPNQPLSGNKLARRLGVSSSTISRYKLRPNFKEWSQDLDPDGIAWIYQDNAFIPMP